MKRNKKNNKEEKASNNDNKNSKNKINNNNTTQKIDNTPYPIVDKKTHIPTLLARADAIKPSGPIVPKPVLTFQQLKEQQAANRKHNVQILIKFLVFSLLMLVTPILAFYFTQSYLSTNAPEISSSDRATYSGITASLSVFAVMIFYTILAIREKID